ncbi:MAG: hypothetical protein ACTSRZ_10225 [Promethearchaeota archaeon]
MVRKNASPFWVFYEGNICVSCGKTFIKGENIFAGKFCGKCGAIEEKKIKLKSNIRSDLNFNDRSNKDNKKNKTLKRNIPKKSIAIDSKNVITYDELNPNNIQWYEFSPICVKCANPFKKGDKLLFGLFCEKCGKKWIKKRELSMPKLKKARGLESSKKPIMNESMNDAIKINATIHNLLEGIQHSEEKYNGNQLKDESSKLEDSRNLKNAKNHKQIKNSREKSKVKNVKKVKKGTLDDFIH